jgi:hypothetical protein
MEMACKIEAAEELRLRITDGAVSKNEAKAGPNRSQEPTSGG